MVKKDAKLAKLEAAVRKQADSLDPAQKEFVLAELNTYKWNAAKIDELQDRIDSLKGATDLDDVIAAVKAEAALVRERHQIITEQTALFGHIMRWLKGTAAEEDELESFLRNS